MLSSIVIRSSIYSIIQISKIHSKNGCPASSSCYIWIGLGDSMVDTNKKGTAT